MIKTFTQNDLIRYLYHETTERETKEINKALLCDADLQKQYTELTTTKEHLNEATMVPSANVIDSILNYSRNLLEKH
jgi:hypothetical protein